MARPLRLSFQNAVYHITARGNRRDNIFYAAKDKDVFLAKMNEAFQKYAFICYAYCLMDNHYHLFLKTPHANITEGMHYLNASYANWFRAKYHVDGAIFQGRYKSILVDEDSYSLALCTYIHLNPIRAGMIDDLLGFKWSSFADYTGKKGVVEGIDTGFILGQLDKNLSRAKKKYAAYVYENMKMESPLKDSYRGIALGSQGFLEKIEARIEAIGEKREIKETKSRGLFTAEEIINKIADKFSVDIDEVLDKRRGNVYRQLALYLVKGHTVLSLREIGDLFGMDYAAVSQACRRFEEKSRVEEDTIRMKEDMRKALRG